MAARSRTRPGRPLARLAAATALALLAACGGGGGGAPAGPPTIDLGLRSVTSPTTVPSAFANPFGVPATATVVTTTGPFAFDPASLPATAPGRGAATVGVVFEPSTSGPAEGTVVLHWDDGHGHTDDVTTTLSAVAEPLVMTVLDPTLAFRDVLLGEAKTLGVRVRNDSTASAGTLVSVALPPGSFAVTPPGLPVLVMPGATATVGVRYQGAAVGAFGGTATFSVPHAAGPLETALSATTGGPVVTDFGSQTLDGSGRTTTLSVDVPSDAISLSLEGRMGTGDRAGLALLTGPSGRVYENLAGTGAYVWIPGDEVFSPTVPNTDRSAVQLETGGGAYAFRLYRTAGSGTSMTVRAIVERRPAGNTAVGRLDLDVWLANAITPKASTAASDSRLQSIISTVDGILGAVGVHVGDVRYHDVSDPTYDDVTDPEFPGLLRLTSSVADPRLNLFFVRTALGGGILGVSATIAGPRVNGTGLSGVMSLYDGGYSAAFVGAVAAHEVGHYLGLYHTCESTGTHDFIDDTLDCPATGTNATCPTAGGGYLMHWQAVGGTTITPGQAHVILGHPCVAADTPPSGALHAATIARLYSLQALLSLESAPPDWCATCARCRPKGR